MTLLKARYSNPAFWHKGRALFQAAHDACGDEALRAQLRGYLAECAQFLGDETGPSGQQSAEEEPAAQWRQPQQRFLFEGQLGGAEAPAPAAPALVGGIPLALAQQLLQQAGSGGAAGEAGAAAEQPPPQALEALQQELDAIAQRIIEETGQQHVPAGAPPASKKVVRSLPKEGLTPARLQELGGEEGVRCPVCMEDLQAGTEVQVMPCKHVFHPECLAPWLEQHNSCPTCRHELPTDDQQYERRKEREREEAEERKGAENALSHNEFLYI